VSADAGAVAHVGAARRLLRRSHIEAAGATVVYAALFAPLALPVLSDPRHVTVGSSATRDYQVFTWALAWWPWALRHGVDPLHTNLVWVPHGFPTVWMTSVPALALLAWPITELAGPMVAFNVLMLAAPVAAALAAYLLARELTGRFWPSLVGGFLFGFSPYMLGQEVAQHLNFVMTWPIPLIAREVLLHARNRTSRRRFVLVSGLLLVVLAGTSLELLAMVMLVAVVGYAIGMCAPALRPALSACAVPAVLAAALLLPVIAVFIHAGVLNGHPELSFDVGNYSTDVVNLVVPTATALAGRIPGALHLSRDFPGNLGEQGGFLGIPLLVVCVLAVLNEPRTRWPLAALAGLLLIASLGPTIRIAGDDAVSNPLALGRLPFYEYAIPARLSVFVALTAACLAAMWLATTRPAIGVPAGICLIAAFMPGYAGIPRGVSGDRPPGAALPLFGWNATAPPSPLAATQLIRHGDRVLVLPFASRAPSLDWQAEGGFQVPLVGGYTPFIPQPFDASVLVHDMVADSPSTLAAERLAAFVRENHVKAVVVGASDPAWLAVTSKALAGAPVAVRGSWVFRVAPVAPSAPCLAAAATYRRWLSPPGGAAAGPRLGVAPDGSGAAAWMWLHGSRARVQAARLDPATGRLGATATVSGDADVADLSLAVAPSRAAIAYTAPSGPRMVSWLALPDGQGWRSIQLTRDGWHTPLVPRLAFDADGGLVVGWGEEQGTVQRIELARIPPGAFDAPATTIAQGEDMKLTALVTDGAVAHAFITTRHGAAVNALTVGADGSTSQAPVSSDTQAPPSTVAVGPRGDMVAILSRTTAADRITISTLRNGEWSRPAVVALRPAGTVQALTVGSLDGAPVAAWRTPAGIETSRGRAARLAVASAVGGPGGLARSLALRTAALEPVFDPVARANLLGGVGMAAARPRGHTLLLGMACGRVEALTPS
jgi:hypothetical protein